MIAVDLYGEKIDRLVIALDYEEKDTYFQAVCEKLLEFIQNAGIRQEQILGAGFAMQGLISPDGQTVSYGKILSRTGLSVHVFGKYLPFPCSFLHDARSAAISELWISPELENAFYLSISKHLGAAVISGRKILTGKHGHSSTIEHISMEPKGRMCYCGKQGCMETLCSLTALLEEKESPDQFFHCLRQGDPSCTKRWNKYLGNLANAINLLHLVFDTDFILGGYLAAYLQEEDLALLHQKIREQTPFDEPEDFLLISKMPKHNISIGAALPYIQAFLNKITNA